MSGIMVALVVFSVLIALGLGTVAGLFIRNLSAGKRLTQAEQEAAQVLERAESQQKSLLLEAKEESMRLRSSADLHSRRAHSRSIDGSRRSVRQRPVHRARFVACS